ncbi:hypothetical protein [Streptomyces sp. NPDC002537]
MDKTFGGEEFRQALAAGTVVAPLAVTGMAKTADVPDAILFALGTRCENWINLPLSLIDSVQPLGQTPCDDHQHPLVRVFLNDTGSPEFTVLAALLRAVQQQPSGCGKPSGPQPVRAQRQPATVTIPPPGRTAAGSTAQTHLADCVDGDSTCDSTGNCWACCHGYWNLIGGCDYGRRFNCNGVPYNAISCWPIG